MPYAKLKTTYNLYQGTPNAHNLGDTPPGWWALIGANKNQATLINPDSPHPTSGTCADFSSSWTSEIGVEQSSIPYHYDSISEPGTLTCKTTQTGDIRTPVITCNGANCCSGDGLNGLIPADVMFANMVRPHDNSIPQCILNIDSNKPSCGEHGKWVTNINYSTGSLNGFCMCDGGWTNEPTNSRTNPCSKKVMCPDPDMCGEGCNHRGNTNCGGWSNYCKDPSCQICCSSNSGCGFMQQPICKDKNTNSYPCWCKDGHWGKGEQLMITSGVPVETNADGIQKYPSICDTKKGDECCVTKRHGDGAIDYPKPGVSGCQDDGYSHDGGLCRNPGDSSSNGIGCGWKIK